MTNTILLHFFRRKWLYAFCLCILTTPVSIQSSWGEDVQEATELVNAGTNEIPANLTLSESLKLAQARNLDLQRASTSVVKQKARLNEARGTLFPVVSLNGNSRWLAEGRRFSFQDGQATTANPWSGTVQIDQPLFQGGKNIQQTEVEGSLLEAIEWQQRGIANQVAFQVYQSYFKVLLDRELLKVREEAVKLLQDELTKSQRKFSVGTISNFDVIRAEVALANAKTPLIQAQNSLALSLEDLKRVLNIDIDRELLSPRVCDSMIRTWDTYTLNDAIKVTKETNPDLKRLHNVLIASKHGVDFQRADFLPSLSLNVNYGVERTQFVSQNFEGWETGLNLKWKLFDGLQTINRVEQAQADVKDAGFALDKAKLDTDIEMRRSLSSVNESRELVDVSSKIIKQAEESFRLAQNRFDVGSATQLDLLSQRLALTEARSNNAQALYSQNVAEAGLRRVMGTLGNEILQ
jgi:outer membrane protein TolC